MLENEEINEELDILEEKTDVTETDVTETDVTEEVTSDDIDPVKKTQKEIYEESLRKQRENFAKTPGETRRRQKEQFKKDRLIHPIYKDNKLRYEQEIEEFLKGDLTPFIGTDSKNWMYILPQEYGGRAETGDDNFYALQKQVKSEMWSASNNPADFQLTEDEYNELFLNAIRTKAEAQKTNNIKIAKQEALNAGHEETAVIERVSLATFASSHNMEVNDVEAGTKLVNDIKLAYDKINEYKENKKEVPGQLTTYVEDLITQHQRYIETHFGKSAELQLGWDNNMVFVAEGDKPKEQTIGIDSMDEASLLEMITSAITIGDDRTEGEIMSDNLKLNYRRQAVHDRKGKDLISVTINNEDAEKFLKGLDIKPTGKNKNGIEFSVPFEILGRYYEQLVVSEGDIAGMNPQQKRRVGFDSPDGYFALTDNVDLENYTWWQKVWDQGETYKDDPNKAFKRSLKDYNIEHFDLIKERTILMKASLLNVDPSSLSKYDLSAKGIIDFGKNLKTVFDRGAGLDYTMLNTTDASAYKWGSRQVDSQLEEYFSDQGITLSPILKQNLKTGGLYEFSERLTEFMPVIGKFLLIDGVINKTGLLRAPLALIHQGRKFKNAKGVLLTDDVIKSELKLSGMQRGSDDFIAWMGSKGYSAVKATAHARVMDFTARAIVEEGKMYTAFQDHYKAGGGTAFLGVGKILHKVFPNTLWNSNRMATFLGLQKSGTAGMISTQMAANLEAFVDSLRGRKDYQTFIDEFYSDLGETTRSAILDYTVFAALGIKGVYSIKGAGPFGGFKSSASLQQLKNESFDLAQKFYKEYKKDNSNTEARDKYRKYAELYSNMQARLKWLDKPNKEKSEEIASKTQEAVNKFDPENKIKIEFSEKGESSYSSKKKIITMNREKPEHLAHEVGHWLGDTQIKGNKEMMVDMFDMMKDAFPGLEKSIVETYGTPILYKTGKKKGQRTGDFMMEKELTVEEFVMHTVSKLGEKGNYDNLVANNVFRRLAENTNNYFISKFGKEFKVFGEYDLTSKSEVIRFWGNFAKVVKEGNLTENYLKFMKKTLNDPRYMEYLESKITLSEIGGIIKDPKIQEQMKSDKKLAKDLETRVQTEMMDLYNKQVAPYSTKGNPLFEEDLSIRKEKEAEAIKKYFLQPRMIKGPDGKRVRVDAAAKTVAYWFAAKTQKAYPEMTVKEIEILANVALTSTKNRGVKNIIENYIKYETADGKTKQDIWKTITSQLMTRQADLYKEAFPGKVKDKQLGGEYGGEIKEGMFGSTEQKDFDVVTSERSMLNPEGVKLAPNFNMDLLSLEASARKFIEDPNTTLKTVSSANNIYNWFSKNTKIESQLRDQAYVSDKSISDLKKSVEAEMLENVKNPQSEFYIKNFDIKKHADKLSKLVNKKFKSDLVELREEFIFTKGDLILDALPKNIDMVTGESNFVLKTFKDLYTPTGERYSSTAYPKDAKTPGQGGPIFKKNVYGTALEAKKAIMKVLLEPAPGGKPLTNAQKKTRLEQAMKYVAYSMSNQIARESLIKSDVQGMLVKSNEPLINQIKIEQTYTEALVKARMTLGSKKLYAKDVLVPVWEKLSRSKTGIELETNVYNSPELLNSLNKNNIPVEKFVLSLQKDLGFVGEKKGFTILDQTALGNKASNIELVVGESFHDGVTKVKSKYSKFLVTNTLGKNHRAEMKKSKVWQDHVFNGYKDMSNGITVKVGNKEVVKGGLHPDLVNSLMINKFFGSGSVDWRTGVYQEIGASKKTGKPKWLTLSSDALKQIKADYKIVGNPNVKLSAKQKKAIKNYKIVDNGEAKRINLEILTEFRKKKADFSDPKVQEAMRVEFNKRTGYTKEVIEANEIVLEMILTNGKEYFDAHPNKVSALNNLIFTYGSQTNIGGGPIRGLASHRSFTTSIESLLKDTAKGRSEHGLPSSQLAANWLNIIQNGGYNWKTKLKTLVKEYKQDIITSEAQKATDFVTLADGRTISVNTVFDPENILKTGTQSTWLKTFNDANNQVLTFGDYKTMADKYTANVVTRLINDLAVKGVSKKYAKNFSKEELIHKLIKIENANRGVFGPKKQGGTFLDLDDTLVFTNSKIKWVAPDGKKGTLTAEEYAKTYENLLEKGYEFDFTEFNEIKEPKLAPLFQKALKLQAKFGPEHMYIVTARPPEAAPAIYAYLKSKGLNIPFENITGLGNSTGEAKALFIAEKIGEGYNDIYFADDVLKNIQAVKNVVDQFDVKSKIQLARKQYALDLNTEFNKMIERVKGIEFDVEISGARAKIDGKNKKRFSLFMEPSAEDFMGLLYRFAGKGKQGDKDIKLFEDNLIKPFLRGTANVDAARQAVITDYKALQGLYPNVVKKLRKKVPGSVFTHDVAVRVHRWTQAGFEIPELSKAEHKFLFEYVANNKELLAFSEQLGLITKTEVGWTKPQEDWMADTIQSDLSSLTTGVNRTAMLFEFMQNREALFGNWKRAGGKFILDGANMNKVEAAYGSRFREALEDIMYRMEFDTKMSSDNGRIVNEWNKWVNGSVGSIMFLNTRSATLQMLSTVNYMNWSDNNPLKVAQTVANPKQFIKDLRYIMNSDMLTQRRSGLKMDINEAALAKAVSGKSNPVKGVVAYLLKKGFMPTQIADSLAISIGGASFYRNRAKTYQKEGMSLKEAEAKAWVDFMDVTQKTQQSSSPYLISQQQSTSLGKTVLSFNNTPMQYNRIMKKAFLDIANKRGDIKTHISKIIYYGAAQNFIFHGLQQGLFALAFDEQGIYKDKEEQKTLDVIHGMCDTILRGTGLTGAVLTTVKNTLIEYYKQEAKGWNSDHAYTVLEMAGLSPSISKKLKGTYGAIKQIDYNEGASKYMNPWAFNNPSLLAKAQVIESTTNLPLARAIQKVNNVKGALDNRNEGWQRIGMGAGWNSWQLGVVDPEVRDLNEMFKKYKKQNKAAKKKPL